MIIASGTRILLRFKGGHHNIVFGFWFIKVMATYIYFFLYFFILGDGVNEFGKN